MKGNVDLTLSDWVGSSISVARSRAAVGIKSEPPPGILREDLRMQLSKIAKPLHCPHYRLMLFCPGAELCEVPLIESSHPVAKNPPIETGGSLSEIIWLSPFTPPAPPHASRSSIPRSTAAD